MSTYTDHARSPYNHSNRSCGSTADLRRVSYHSPLTGLPTDTTSSHSSVSDLSDGSGYERRPQVAATDGGTEVVEASDEGEQNGDGDEDDDSDTRRRQDRAR